MKAALGVPMRSEIWTRAREAVFANRPISYICIILVVAVVSSLYQLRTRSIFSCHAEGYSIDRYLSYCNGANYGDYEHGAFYFNLEPSAQQFAKNADVLFLGNSRLEIAFSTSATADWFSRTNARYYLFGFDYFENMVFTEEMLRKIQPRAGTYVINVDDFFGRSETAPVKVILHDPTARSRYETKRFWQHIHKPICQTFVGICGNDYAIFRSRENGEYSWRPVNPKVAPVSYDEEINRNSVRSSTAAAIDFLSHYIQGKCVILTMVPTAETKIGNANGIARALGVNLVTPGNLDGLRTFDGSHLEPESAERWSRGFFQAAGPKIRSCLEKEGAPRA